MCDCSVCFVLIDAGCGVCAQAGRKRMVTQEMDASPNAKQQQVRLDGHFCTVNAVADRLRSACLTYILG